MIVMHMEMNNFYALKNFQMNMSYPKKIVSSYVKNEYLKDRPNFRYIKVNILMGANATGKTSIGKILMQIFNFMDDKQYTALTKTIADQNKEASFSIDFVGNDAILYRVHTVVKPSAHGNYTAEHINVRVTSVKINLKDSYETCVQRLEKKQETGRKNYLEELEKIKGLSWIFQYPFDYDDDRTRIYTAKNPQRYTRILENILKTLDPSILKVEMSEEIENTHIIRYPGKDVIIQNGQISGSHILSSGTKAGVEIAGLLASIMEDEYGFYYCDEKFSYIHSDIEKAILSLMIRKMNDNDQLFFTTHNTDILDLPLPRHAFTFLIKDLHDTEQPIKCINAASLLKRNTDSLKHAVENDLFTSSPCIDPLYELAEL
ncbi:MAG: ATP-binding protein [Candidatus Gastranaerophilales bacterium]|nr:ATP-binding protein [Candidatus Gastranaerophilales bacterium]